MKKSLLPVMLVGFSSLSLIAVGTAAESQLRRMQLAALLAVHTGGSTGAINVQKPREVSDNDWLSEQSSPVGDPVRSTPVGSPPTPVDEYMRKRQSK